MQRVEDNVVITQDQDTTTRSYLNQRVWDSSAKTLTKTRVASSDGSGVDLNNFHSSSGAQYLPTYGTNSGSGTGMYPYWGIANQTSPTYISAVEGRDGKWHFRYAQNGSSSRQYIRQPKNYSITYIPSSMGGDLATSGWSQSWGLTGGFLDTNYNNGNGTPGLNGGGLFGVFLPINVESSAVSSANTNYPQFYLKSWAEMGGYNMVVHEDGTANTEMNYHTSTSGNSSWRPKQAVWLDSNHFFVHSCTNVSNNSYWTGSSNYQMFFVNQYIDETYTDNQSYGNIGSNQSYQTMGANNSGSQWTKIDDYTLTCNGFNYIHNIWAPE
jgi:hypothetical protein